MPESKEVPDVSSGAPPPPVAGAALVAPSALVSSVASSAGATERRIIWLVGAIQFVNVLDFMMVMPLGPDFAADLGVPTSHIGLVGGSYTAAAAVSGVAGSFFLDRFDRRWALGVTLLGLVIGTVLGGFATGLGTLLLARVVAGCFGGPATSLSMAVIADVIPPERRGKALGAVMGAFSIASVLGVPVGLELARRFGWRMPFFAVGALGLLLSAAAIAGMPPLRDHLARRGVTPQPKVPLLNRLTFNSLLNTALLMGGLFAVVPNISAFVQHNLQYPRERIGLLYMVGGAASFVCLRVVGAVVDKVGASRVFLLGTALHALALLAGFIYATPGMPVMFVFTLFMLSGSVRMVPMQSLSTRVPRPEQRASFMSAQSAVQHLASAAGAMAASWVLIAAPSGPLEHMDQVAWAALLLACLAPFGVFALERRVRARDATRTAAAASAP